MLALIVCLYKFSVNTLSSFSFCLFVVVLSAMQNLVLCELQSGTNKVLNLLKSCQRLRACTKSRNGGTPECRNVGILNPGTAERRNAGTPEY